VLPLSLFLCNPLQLCTFFFQSSSKPLKTPPKYEIEVCNFINQSLRIFIFMHPILNILIYSTEFFFTEILLFCHTQEDCEGPPLLSASHTYPSTSYNFDQITSVTANHPRGSCCRHRQWKFHLWHRCGRTVCIN
jgi:hypothetical protein